MGGVALDQGPGYIGFTFYKIHPKTEGTPCTKKGGEDCDVQQNFVSQVKLNPPV